MNIGNHKSTLLEDPIRAKTSRTVQTAATVYWFVYKCYGGW